MPDEPNVFLDGLPIGRMVDITPAGGRVEVPPACQEAFRAMLGARGIGDVSVTLIQPCSPSGAPTGPIEYHLTTPGGVA